MPGQQSSKGLDQLDLVKVLIRLDTLISELKTDVGTIATFQTALTAKLDADSGVGDTDYASSLTEVAAPSSATPMSASDLSALTFTVT